MTKNNKYSILAPITPLFDQNVKPGGRNIRVVLHIVYSNTFGYGPLVERGCCTLVVLYI